MKYSLSAFYKDYIKESILKNYLRNGKIPKETDIENELSKTLKSSEDFSKPLLSSTDYFIENGEVSSAKKVNTIFNTIESDLSVCVSAIMDQENKISNLYDTSYLKMSGLQKRIDLIKQDVDKVLFESKNTDTHEEIFYEKFSSLDMVDSNLSTVSIDIKAKEATLKSTEQYPIDLSSSVQGIQIIPEINPKIIESTEIGEMKIENIFKNNNKVWMYQISASDPLSSVSLDLIIRIPSSGTEINKILLEPYSVDLRTQVNLELAFSDDGLNWTYPDGEFKKRLLQTTSLSFKGIKKDYWRIRFTKFGNDGFFSNFYAYNFGLKSLNFYGKKYDKISRLDLGYFYSKPIFFNNNVKMANLKVCQDCVSAKNKNIPNGTLISYYLAPIYQSQVAAITSGSMSPKDLYYYTIKLNDKDSATIDFLTTTESPITNNISADEAIEYKEKRQYDFCLDFSLPAGYAKKETIILRNKVDQNLYNALGQEKTFNSSNFGWNFDGNYYSTYLLVEDPSGLEIDLGSTEMYINNLKVQGKVNIAKGLNFIVTHRDNWKSLDLTTLPVESDQVIDQLYPYNHKYLIEGFGDSLYGRDLAAVIDGESLIGIIDKEGIYSKSPKKCWAIKMKELDFFSFVSKNKNELDVFCYKIDNTNQERIVVKSDPDLGLITNETFSIITKLHSAENIKGLIFKAVLETNDDKISPVLTEYFVKIK
jgi:hypothetical protein